MPITSTPGSYHPSQIPTRRDLQYTYDTIREWARSVSNCPLINGQLISDVKVGVAPQTIRHGLGRRPIGLLVVIMDSPVQVFVISRDDKTLTVESSADATVSVWVF